MPGNFDILKAKKINLAASHSRFISTAFPQQLYKLHLLVNSSERRRITIRLLSRWFVSLLTAVITQMITAVRGNLGTPFDQADWQTRANNDCIMFSNLSIQCSRFCPVSDLPQLRSETSPATTLKASAEIDLRRANWTRECVLIMTEQQKCSWVIKRAEQRD